MAGHSADHPYFILEGDRHRAKLAFSLRANAVSSGGARSLAHRQLRSIKEERPMPVVTIQVTKEGSSPERSSISRDEKAQLIAGVSQLLLDVLNKPLDSTFVVIEEVELENWGWGGLPVREFRKARFLQSERIEGELYGGG
jgi:4-oxalocrotonate tautomerase